MNNSTCSYVSAVHSCGYNADQCVKITTPSQCDTQFCNQVGDCTSQGKCEQGQSEALCLAQLGCDWQNYACNVSVDCKAGGSCDQKKCKFQTFTCSDNQDVGKSTCSAQNKEQCAQQTTFCVNTNSLSQGTCKPKQNLCFLQESGASCSEQVCDKKIDVSSKCANKVDCPSDTNNCGNDCDVSPFQCIPNNDTSKCSALPLNECGIVDQKCKNTQVCQPSYSKCSQADGKDKSDCAALSSTCVFTSAQGTCTVKQQVRDECAIQTTPQTCTGNCVYTPAQYFCNYIANQCLTQTYDNCQTQFCTKTITVCESSIDDCTLGMVSQAKCEELKGCAWVNSSCTILSVCKNSICPQDKCKYKTFICSDNQTTGQNTCNKFTKDECQAQIHFCAGSTIAGTCQPKQNLCVFGESGASCITSICDKNIVNQSKCTNNICSTDINNCGTDCSVSPYQCVPKE